MSFGGNSRLSRVLAAGAVGLAVALACVPSVQAADDDNEDDAMIDTKIFRHIMSGLGLRREEPDIEYRERSPLVLPRGEQNLPAPETANPAKTAGWPDDPDVKKAKRRKQAEKDRKPYTEGVDDRPLMPSEYSVGAPKGSRAGEASGKSAEDSAKPSSQAELGAKSLFSGISTMWAPKEEYTTFTGEPPRASLLDPPRGYRTPSPNQPYGVGKEKWKPGAPGDRHMEAK